MENSTSLREGFIYPDSTRTARVGHGVGCNKGAKSVVDSSGTHWQRPLRSTLNVDRQGGCSCWSV